MIFILIFNYHSSSFVFFRTALCFMKFKWVGNRRFYRVSGWCLQLTGRLLRGLKNDTGRTCGWFVLTLSSLTQMRATGVGEIWRGVRGPVAWHRAGDEDRSSCVWRRGWRGVPRPPQQDRKDEEAAVAAAESLRGRLHGHGARRVAEELPLVRHGYKVWGESGQNYTGFLASFREEFSVIACNSCCVCPKASLCLTLLTDIHFVAFYNFASVF